MTTISPTQKKSIIFGCLFLVVILLGTSLLGKKVLHSVGIYEINKIRILISSLISWFCLGAIGLYSIKIEKQPLLIWQDKHYKWTDYLLSLLAILGAVLVVFILVGIVFYITHSKLKSIALEQMVAVFRINKWLIFITTITAGITEELLMRGYLQTRLVQIFNNPWLAIFLSSLFFGLMHFGYGTLLNMIGPFMMGLIFAYYYWKYRNIKVLMLFHFLWDTLLLFAHFLPLRH